MQKLFVTLSAKFKKMFFTCIAYCFFSNGLFFSFDNGAMVVLS